MSFRQMEYLVTVVEEGSFTAAAERLGVTQPTLSHQVRVLEREVGVPLLERLPGRVLLTPMGREYLPHAVAALRSARLALGEGTGRPGPVHLRIATMYSIALGVVPPAVRAWLAAEPGAEVEVVEFASGTALERHVAAGGADLGVGPLPARWDGPLYELGEEELVLVLPVGDPLAGRADLPLRELADRPWVLYDAGNALAPLVAAACADAGFEPVAAVRTHHSATAVQLAASGLGPALVPTGVLEPGLPVVALRPSPPIRRTLAAYLPGPPSPATSRFITHLLPGP
ncbi:DNA-binding transcriptional LysR family regulator [Actinocorallia herbida]|uniref:DNA-binding transcriptional LysR family regulator n=1 Tax=Actinocorallia herbida TaxID=58109 RepID=A0A3N1D568_9ACTN|nr:LysR family transcriptional regulator [Actinocorallia herbida]ROO88640.1 DNA-binding transcriptional LysR family regulator [Actinocorallia herbida]